MTEEEYRSEIEFIFNLFPSYQKVGKIAYKPGIETMQYLDKLLNYPHKKFKTIHIAGTNGKGSTSHILASAFMQLTSNEFYSSISQNNIVEKKDGKHLKVGLYTSPHLWDFRERIKISTSSQDPKMQMIDKEFVYDFIKKYKYEFIKINASFFEITTILAFAYFAYNNVDLAIIECGLGGRLDSTNVITPIMSIITNIGLDHCEHLGYTLTDIAKEKAGIIKENVPVIIGETGKDIATDSDIVDWKAIDPKTIDLRSKKYKIVGSDCKSGPLKIVYKILKKSLILFPLNDAVSIEKVFKEKATESMAPILFAEHPDRYTTKLAYNLYYSIDINKMDLQGSCQQKNIKPVVLTLCRLLNKNDSDFKKIMPRLIYGINNAAKLTGLHGRWERLSFTPSALPEFICDTGHNAHGFKLIGNQLRTKMLAVDAQGKPKYGRMVLIFGVTADKDIASIVKYLPKTYVNSAKIEQKPYFYFVNAAGKRALQARKLAYKMHSYGFKGVTVSASGYNSSVMDGIKRYLSDSRPDDFVFIGGSSYVVGQLENFKFL